MVEVDFVPAPRDGVGRETKDGMNICFPFLIVILLAAYVVNCVKESDAAMKRKPEDLDKNPSWK